MRTYLDDPVADRTLAGAGVVRSTFHGVRDTNAQPYDYERTGGELSFVRVF